MHELDYITCDLNANKQDIYKEIDSIARERSDYHSGLHNRLEWVDRTFDTFEDAYNHVMKHCFGDYQCVAYKYRDINSLPKSKKALDIENRIKELKENYRSLNSKIHYKDVQSKFITCKTCGSKLNKDYLKSNSCPMCNQDMRPESVLNKLKTMKDKIAKLENELKTEKLKNKSKAKVKWLVKFEYHC